MRSRLLEAGARLQVPVRDFAPGIRYSGRFYGQDGRGWPVPEAISVDGLIRVLEELPEGVTELGCHPGDPDGLATMYADERRVELETLCDPRVRSAIDHLGIRLCSFTDLRRGAPGPPGQDAQL